VKDITLVGSTFPPEEFASYLEERDPCFGKHFAKSADACKDCLAPVIVDGTLTLLRDLCHARCEGAESPAMLKALTSQDVRNRLAAGKTVAEIFTEVLGDSDPSVAAAAARDLLYRRFYYLRTEKGFPVPDLPPTKELAEHVHS